MANCIPPLSTSTLIMCDFRVETSHLSHQIHISRELAKATYRGAAPPFDACAPPFDSCAPLFDFCAPSFKCPLKSAAPHFGKTVRRPALALALRPGQPSRAALESACACMYLVFTITQVSQPPDSNFCCSARRLR